MADEEKVKSWWQTLPGIIASVTAATTAFAGLLVALKQVGWIGSPQPPAAPAPQQQQSSQGAGSSGPPPASAAPASTLAAASHPVSLPELREYKLDTATFTLLSATLSPQTAEKDALRIQIRMMNNNSYDANFWDRSFRLMLDGVPTAPESNLNELVPARSAKDGAVLFALPRGTASAKLEISYGNEQTLIPLVLAGPR
ncbi:hypothetical protein [Variovorax sp. YR216]|uniref:hypothetical protein n=1 Tax=Variovorax sp. YR216 TaxID=1882828 RepID=UPI00089D45BA|nr:hypothetical protein [Variovorax sp. YR216]SEB23010.1 hypothetical protein SAMN05444680_11739 [Variovorax sp. YR216]